MQVFDVRDSLHGTLYCLRLFAQIKRINFNVKIEPNVPQTILFDKGRLQQIVTNLISNAIKFSTFKPVRFNVSVNLETQQLILMIVDEGVGICRNMFSNVTQGEILVNPTTK